MGSPHTAQRAGSLLCCAFVLLATVVGALVLPARASALGGPPDITLDQSLGGRPTRFTFTAISDKGEKIDGLTLTFPAGFNVDRSRVEVVTLAGLNRISNEATASAHGADVHVSFKPPIPGSSQLRVTIYDVKTITKGGTYSVGIAYTANGQMKTSPPLSFSYATPAIQDDIAAWLDKQAWVQAYNSSPFLDEFFQPQLIVLAFPLLFAGWLVSIALVLVAFPLAIAGGLMFAFMKMAKFPPLRWLASGYINVIRGTPLFLQIFVAFVGLPLVGIRPPWFIGAVIVLALNSSAYLAEIFRAGIQSISKGQFEAASSLGMTYPQAMAYVIVPQTVKRVLPTMTSEFILLFKDTALLSAVGVFELMLYANNLVARTGNITPFMVAAVYYLLITTPLINWVGALEARLAISEGGQTAASSPRKQRYWWKKPVELEPGLAGPTIDKEGR